MELSLLYRLLATVHSTVLIVLTFENGFDALENSRHKLVIGILCDGEDSVLALKMNATWRTKSQTTTGSEFKIELVYLRAPASKTLQEANEVARALRQKLVTMVIGRHELLYTMATADARIPYLVTSHRNEDEDRGFRVEAKEEGGSSSSYDALDPPSPGLSLRLMPHTTTFDRAITDVIEAFQWKGTVALIYESTRGLDLMGRLMEEEEKEDGSSGDVEVRGWRISRSDDVVHLRLQLSRIRSLEIRQIVAECEPPLLERLLDAALRLSMLSMRYSWIFVHPLPTIVNYDPFNYTGVNFTALSLSRVTPPSPDADPLPLTTAGDHLDYMMISDALDLVTTALEKRPKPIDLCSPQNASVGCSQNMSSFGVDLLERMKQISIEGSSGKIEFDSSGQRSSTELKILALSTNGLEEIGDWKDGRENRLRIRRWTNQSHLLSTRPLKRAVNRVVTLIDPPFVMYKKSDRNLTGNDRFEGFLVDLFDRIAKNLQFQYELYESPDGNYGSKDAKGNWNGMIRELIIGNASMCLGAISITSDREEVVDFSKPFKQKMFNFLMKKPEEVSTIFQFLSPLSTTVWIAILSSLLLVSFLIFLMDRFSPNYPSVVANDHDPDHNSSSSRVGLRESIWFMYGALVGGGTEGWSPRTVSGRLLTSAWWFFGLIIISSYTANLAAFLTVTKIETPIKSITDLARQKTVRYGTVRNTYAMSMFKNSQLEILRDMWINMDTLHPDWMVGNTQEGIAKAKEGGYAFIWDAPINRHIATYECSVIATGEPFDEKGYGIGVPVGASYRDDLTMEILGLGEKGEIVQMENRWWRAGECPEFTETSATDNEELNMFNVAGVFLLLGIGALLALIACLLEYTSTRLITCPKFKRKHGNNLHRVQDEKPTPLTVAETPLCL